MSAREFSAILSVSRKEALFCWRNFRIQNGGWKEQLNRPLRNGTDLFVFNGLHSGAARYCKRLSRDLFWKTGNNIMDIGNEVIV